MSRQTKVTGMVLSAMDIGDYDKRLVILTKEQGRISAFAKGARRPNSTFMASSQPFTFGEFTIYMGRHSNSINNVEVSNYFSGLRNDLEMVYYGMYFCEFADHITREYNDEREILKLLYMSLLALEKQIVENKLIKAIFELKAIALNGQAPQVFQCVKCNEIGKNYKSSIALGGLLCESCQSNDPYAIVLSDATIYAIQYIISKDVKDLFKFKLKENCLNELWGWMIKYRQHHIGYNFKTLEFLKML